jgi:uncharacterized protein (TIGR02246 family)
METVSEKKAIEQLLLAYGEALNASSTAQVLPLYTADGLFMPTNAPSATGHDSLKASYDGIFKMIQLRVHFNIEEIVVSGDLAFAVTSSKGTTLIHDSGETIPEENRELFVLQKENGAWKIARYMFNKTK